MSKINQDPEIPKSRFKARALEYFRQVERTGKAVIVTDKGLPVVEVRRYRADTRSPIKRLHGSVKAFEAPTAPVDDDDWQALK